MAWREDLLSGRGSGGSSSTGLSSEKVSVIGLARQLGVSEDKARKMISESNLWGAAAGGRFWKYADGEDAYLPTKDDATDAAAGTYTVTGPHFLWYIIKDGGKYEFREMTGEEKITWMRANPRHAH